MFVNDTDIWLDGSICYTMFVNYADRRLKVLYIDTMLVNDVNIKLNGSTS